MKQTNKIKSATYRVLKQEDLLLFESARDYDTSVRQDTEAMRTRAIEEIEQLKTETKTRLIAEVHQQQQELMNNLDKKLAVTFSQLRDDLYLLIYKTLHQFGVFSYDPAQIKQVIEYELGKYDSRLEELAIYANSHTREKLLAIYHDIDSRIRVDETLGDDECILESKLYIFRLNLTNAINKLDQLLKGYDT